MPEPAAFQDYQRRFAAALRAPRPGTPPPGASARRMRVYRELVFNKIDGVLRACFPVAHAVLGARRWPRLVRRFLVEARAQTPYFREIPREFVNWFAGVEDAAYPAWLAELLHYEWAELAVDVMPAAELAADGAGDLGRGRPLLNPAMLLLSYRWPVHRIGPAYRPRREAPVQLLVYRDAQECVRFMQLSPLSALLLELLREAPARSGRAALLQLARRTAHPDASTLLACGLPMLEQWRHDGVILGTLPEG